MSDSKGDSSKQHDHDPDDRVLDPKSDVPHQQQPSQPFISSPLYVRTTYAAANTKRPRYTASHWKLSPTTVTTAIAPASQTAPQPAPASSSDTDSSPSHSPRPSHSAASTQETNPNPEVNPKKGKYVSPVWKPNEMLWLARAWRIQYQGGGSGSGGSESDPVAAVAPATARGKTRADKDREVAEYLNRHGVNRDAKTAGTKWDNMLGEFRKVYEWERGGERDQVGKSYFRLSPYERKLHRLPASFDEEVFDELSQFMGSRIRTTQSRNVAISTAGEDVRPVTRPLQHFLHYRDEDNVTPSGRGKQIVLAGGGGGGLGLETPSEMLGSSSSREIRRIGRVRMTWEESVSLWAEEGENGRGRVKVESSSFINADEVAFLDASMVACTLEAFEDGPLKGLSVDRFLPGQQVKVFGRRKSFSAALPAAASGFIDRPQLPSSAAEPSSSFRSTPTWEFQDPTDYYVGCLRVPPPTLPSLFELSWHLQEPPPEDFRFPLRKDVYKDLPQGKELFFYTSTDLVLDCRGIMYDIISPIMRQNPSLSSSTATGRDSFIGLWDDCVNRIISKFCCVEMVFVRKTSSPMSETVQNEWPNVCAFLRNFCLWRGEEIHQLREDDQDPSSSIVEKLLWTYTDLPYILGYYAVGYNVTFCAISRSQDRIIRTDLYNVDLSNPTERLKALVPCYRIAGLLALLSDRCLNLTSVSDHYSDFERIDLTGGNILEMTPHTMVRFFTSKRKWAAVKEIYDFLDQRIPHAEFILRSSEKELGLLFKPRGCRIKPANCDQLVEALKQVTKALVALHDLSFMHRDLGWEKVLKRNDGDSEWVVTGFDEAVGAPQIYPHGGASGRHAPEMDRGLHGVKVDVWGVGLLIKSCGLAGLPKLLRELQNRCLENSPEQRPTAADCYRHLLQIQSSLSSAASGGY